MLLTASARSAGNASAFWGSSDADAFQTYFHRLLHNKIGFFACNPDPDQKECDQDQKQPFIWNLFHKRPSCSLWSYILIVSQNLREINHLHMKKPQNLSGFPEGLRLCAVMKHLYSFYKRAYPALSAAAHHQ